MTSASVAGTTIFRQQISGDRDSEGAVPLGLTSVRRFVLPFDNTRGFVTAMALANEDPTQSSVVSVVIRNQNGQPLGTESLNLNPLGRTAFTLPTRFQET